MSLTYTMENHRVRRVDDDGVSTVVGGGSGFVDASNGDACFNFPSGGAFDRHGRLLVVDMENNRVRAVSAERAVATLAGGADEARALAAADADRADGVDGVQQVRVRPCVSARERSFPLPPLFYPRATVQSRCSPPPVFHGEHAPQKF